MLISQTFAGDEGGDDPSRVGDTGNPLLGSNHLDTMISGRDGMTGMSQSLQRAQNRANSHNQNGKTSTANLQAAFSRISEKCDVMQLGAGITTRAQHVYKIADEKKVTKGKNEDVVIAACIIFACRDNGANRSFTEVCKALRVSKKVSIN
jgi:transcription initiation factor TFIIB